MVGRDGGGHHVGGRFVVQALTAEAAPGPEVERQPDQRVQSPCPPAAGGEGAGQLLDRTGDYPNFVEQPADASAFFDADTWARLRAVKAAYDPSDLFKGNHHIPPAERAEGVVRMADRATERAESIAG